MVLTQVCATQTTLKMRLSLEDLRDAEETDIDNFGNKSDDEEETQNHQEVVLSKENVKISEVFPVNSGNLAASLLSIVEQRFRCTFD